MPLRRCARLAPLGQRARCLGSGSAAEAPDALIRRLGRDILRHVPAATRVRELEQQMHLITSEHELWRKSLRECPFPEPWWAFLWPGGFALSKWCSDNPDRLAGRRVIDFASGCGSSAIQAAAAGATHVTANDIDCWAGAAIAINASINRCSASINGVTVSFHRTGQDPPHPLGAISIELRDIVGLSRRELGDVDVLIAGDVMYEDAFAKRVTAWLQRLSTEGCTVIVGDPGRHFLDKSRLIELAAYPLPQAIRDDNYGFQSASVWVLQTSAAAFHAKETCL